MESNGNDALRPLVAEFRSKLTSILATNGEKLGVSPDCNFKALAYANDAFVRRFLRRKDGNVDRAVGQLIRCLQFAAQMNLGVLKKSHFPPEIYLGNLAMLYKTDREQHPCVYLRAKALIPELLDPMIIKFLALLVLEVAMKLGDQNVCIVYDGQGFGWSNVPSLRQMGFIKFAVRLYNIAPSFWARFVIYNSPRSAAWLYEVGKQFVPRQIRSMITFVRGKEIERIIPPENLPYFITGGAVSNHEDQVCSMDDVKDCLDFDSAVKFHGHDMELYNRKVKPRIRQMVREEFAAFPAQLAGRKSVFLADDY